MKNFTHSLKFILLCLTVLCASSAQAGIVLTENFDKFLKGEPNGAANSTDVSGSLDTYTQTPGWTGLKVYQAGGTIKLGGGSDLGYITTPTIDLSGNNGNFTIRFKAMAWKGDSQSMLIKINGVAVDNAVTDMNNDDSYTLKDYELELTGGTATTQITFEGSVKSKGRFFLEDIEISSGTAGPVLPKISATITPITFGKEFDVAENPVKTLSVAGSNLKGDITLTLSGDNAAVFSVSPTTLTQVDGTVDASDVAIGYNPTALGRHIATLTISSTDAASLEISLVGSCYALEGDGTKELPYTCIDVKILASPSPTVTAWVKGYIVGIAKTGDPTNGDLTEVTLGEEQTLNTNIVLAPTASSTDFTEMIAIQLPSGPIRDALNLVDNVSNYGKLISVHGDLLNYFSSARGVKNPTEFEFSTSTALGKEIASTLVYASNGTIIINATAGELVQIYNSVGQLITSFEAAEGINAVTPYIRQMYIVKVGNKAVKVTI